MTFISSLNQKAFHIFLKNKVVKNFIIFKIILHLLTENKQYLRQGQKKIKCISYCTLFFLIIKAIGIIKNIYKKQLSIKIKIKFSSKHIIKKLATVKFDIFVFSPFYLKGEITHFVCLFSNYFTMNSFLYEQFLKT